MNLKEFKAQVDEAFPYGIEYADDVKYEYNEDDGGPECKMTVEFGGGHIYELRLIVGADGEVGLQTYEDNTVELYQEWVFAMCLFKSQERHDEMLRKAEKR